MGSLIFAGLVLLSSAFAESRTWTDSSGKHTVDAEFVDLDGTAVRLRRPSGQVISIPLNRLCEEDREYVRQQTEQHAVDEAELERCRKAIELSSKWRYAEALAVVGNADSPLDKAVKASLLSKSDANTKFKLDRNWAKKTFDEVSPWLDEHADIPEVAFLLGIFLGFREHITEPDPEKAFKLFTDAADKGFTPALNYVVLAYAAGKGVEKDAEKAFSIARRVSLAGDTEATWLAAQCFDKGLGTEQNTRMAEKLYKRAAASGHASAMFLLSTRAFQEGMRVAEEGPRGWQGVQERHFEEAVRWAEKAAELGHGEAHWFLGVSYLAGAGLEMDEEQGIAHLRTASDSGSALATKELAECYHKGRGVPKDRQNAKLLLDKAIEQAKWQRETSVQEDAEKLARKWQQLEKATLVVTSWHWKADRDVGFVTVEGLVQNNSRERLKGVQVLATFLTGGGDLVTSDSSFIEYNPVLPGQTSPFKVMVKYNPAMATCSLGFKFFAGGAIAFAIDD